MLARRGCETLGVDAAEGMIERARELTRGNSGELQFERVEIEEKCGTIDIIGGYVPVAERSIPALRVVAANRLSRVALGW